MVDQHSDGDGVVAAARHIALVVLRCVVALTLIVETHSVSALGWAHVLDAFAALVGLILFLGLLTPYCAALCCVLELAFLVANGIRSGFQLGMSAMTAASMVPLGPGALIRWMLDFLEGN